MTYVQVVFKIMEEERGYNLKHFVDAGFCRNTMKNWMRNKTDPRIGGFKFFLECMHYDPIKMLNKVAEYENRSSNQTA